MNKLFEVSQRWADMYDGGHSIGSTSGDNEWLLILNAFGLVFLGIIIYRQLTK